MLRIHGVAGKGVVPTIVIAGSLLLMAGAGCAKRGQNRTDNGISSEDRMGSPGGRAMGAPDPARVLGVLHEVNQMEVRLGELALENAENEQVREYAQHLLQEHRQADQEVIQLARSQGISMDQMRLDPESMPTWMQEARDGMEQLQNLSGADFDRRFLQQQVMGHENTIQTINSALPHLEPELARPLGRLVPVLEKHRDSAAQLLNRLGDRQEARGARN